MTHAGLPKGPGALLQWLAHGLREARARYRMMRISKANMARQRLAGGAAARSAREALARLGWVLSQAAR